MPVCWQPVLVVKAQCAAVHTSRISYLPAAPFLFLYDSNILLFKPGHFYEKRKTFQFWYVTNSILSISKGILLSFALLFGMSTFYQALSHCRQRMLQWGNLQQNSDRRECICHIRSHSCHILVTPSHTLTRPLSPRRRCYGVPDKSRIFSEIFLRKHTPVKP